MPSAAELFRAQRDNRDHGLLFEAERWSWADVVQASAERAAVLANLELPEPGHVGILLDNVPEFLFWLGGAAFAGATIVGINPTRRGAELARDITHARCRVIVTESRHTQLLDGLDLGLPSERVLVVDGPEYQAMVDEVRGAPVPDRDPPEDAVYLLLFTSGTTDAPKAAICSQARFVRSGTGVASNFLTPDDVVYAAMPLFHSNALLAAVSPALGAGCDLALRRRFSASAFLDDVRRYGVTWFTYAGKPLSYVLATPERPDDADTQLRMAFGNEAAELDIERFARRFGCQVIDTYGSTEGGVNVMRMPGMPAGALGKPIVEGVAVVDPETGQEKPRARFDADGRLLNAEDAIGELCSPAQVAVFEGYYRNEEANQARVRDGRYWTGDLAYMDEDGWIFFAGRGFDWLRVDGENFAAAPVERILARFPDVVLAVAYGVPDPAAGDQVMAALQLRPGAEFDAKAFEDFLDAQRDLGTKWSPKFVRLSPSLPITASNKIRKRELQAERWECEDPVWWRPGRERSYRPMTPEDCEELGREFARRGRSQLLEARS